MDAHVFVVRIGARPESKTDGPRLADEVVAALDGLLGEQPDPDGELDGRRARQPQPAT